MKRIFAMTLLLSTVSPAPLEPFHGPGGDIEPESAAFFELLDLDRPDLARVKDAVAKKDFHGGLEAWRDALVLRLRAMPLGRFDGRAKSPKSILIPEYLLEKLSEEAYLAKCGNEPDLLDYVGQRAKPGSGVLADFSKPNPNPRLAGRYAYAHYRYLPAFVKAYREGGGDEYRQWFFERLGDFSLHHKRAIEEQYRANPEKFSDRYFDNWMAADAGSSLCQADRVHSLIRSLAGFTKSLTPGDLKAAWDACLAPLPPPAANWDRNKVPARDTALLVLSLVLDHPVALVGRYEKAGAVPNQRFFGLTSIGLIAATFPEFQLNGTLLETANRALLDFAKGSFADDGGQLEQSFNYNFGVAADINDLPEFLDPAQIPGVGVLLARRKAFMQMSAALEVPTGGMPWKGTYTPPLVAFHDQASNQIQAAARSRQERYTNAFGAGAKWPPSYTSTCFPYSGYLSLRGGWESTSPYLFMSDCRPARGHGSADVAGIQLSAFGRWLLVSGGSPYYFPVQAVGEQREHFEEINAYFEEMSSLKHNTVLIDGLDQVKSPNPFTQNQAYTNTSGARFHAGKEIDFAESRQSAGWKVRGRSFATPPATVEGDHLRHVFFLRSQACYIVVDQVRDLTGGEHRVEQSWILPPLITNGPAVLCSGFRSEQVRFGASALSTLDPRGANLFMHFSGDRSFALERHEGDKKPYLGWFSRGITAPKVPTVQAQVVARTASGMMLAALIGASSNTISPFNDFQGGEVEEGRVAFLAKLASGALVTFRASKEALPCRVGATSGKAKCWIEVLLPDGARCGVILDGEGFSDGAGDYEYRAGAGQAPVFVRMNAPKRFAWGESPADPRPEYR